MQKISLIAAMSQNYVLGKDNELVWQLPADWENFRKVTAGKPFIMGRISYESSDMLYSSGRNIVLTRQQLEDLPLGFEVANSIEKALESLSGAEEVFILGGGQIFEQSIDQANYMYLTIVHHSFEGDAFFPKPDWKEWVLTRSVYQPKDERHAFDFSLNEYRRK